MPYFPPIRDSKTGTLIDFDFLDPIKLEVKSEKFISPITIRCRFTNHVFSEKVLPGMIALRDEYIIDDRGVKRQFNQERYEISKALPDMMRSLSVMGTKSLDQSTSGNTWHVWYSLDLAGTITRTYHVWFSVRRQNRNRNFGADIEMVVETAYPGRDGSRPNVLGRARFETVVANAFLRKPTRTRK